MTGHRIILVVINLLGGTAVLGSYAWGLITHPDGATALWGGVPPSLVPFYTASMLPAAAGYLIFTGVLLAIPDTGAMTVGRFRFSIFHWLYGAIVLPSALWMPLTFALIDGRAPGLMPVIRLVLAVVGLASLALLAALAHMEPRPPLWRRRMALAGGVAFCFQTAVLDALVWSVLFPVGR